MIFLARPWNQVAAVARALLMALAVLLATRFGAAAERTVRLTWRPSPRAAMCPSEREIKQLVAARLGRDPFADEGTHALLASIERDGSQWQARIALSDGQGHPLGARELVSSGADCNGIAEAMVLAMALAIDADQESQNGRGSKNAASGKDLPMPQSFVPTQCSWCESAKCVPEPPGWIGDVGLRALLGLGILRVPSPGVDLWFDVRIVGPLHAELSALAMSEVRASDPGFTMGLGGARLSLCWDTTAATLSPKLMLCAGGQFGSLSTVPDEGAPPKQQLSWTALSAAPRLRMKSPYSALVFEVGGELVVPIRRERVSLSDGSRRAVGTPIGGVASLGLGLAIP